MKNIKNLLIRQQYNIKSISVKKLNTAERIAKAIEDVFGIRGVL